MLFHFDRIALLGIAGFTFANSLCGLIYFEFSRGYHRRVILNYLRTANR